MMATHRNVRSTEQLRSARARQKAGAREGHVEALRAAAFAIAAGESIEPEEEPKLIALLDKSGVGDDVFCEVVAAAKELTGIEQVTDEALASLKAKQEQLRGRFYAEVGVAKKNGIEAIRANAFGGVAVLYAPLRKPHAEMRTAERAVKEAEKALFRRAELEAKISLLLGEAQAAPQGPKRPAGGAWSRDDTERRPPDDPQRDGHKAVRRTRDGKPVIVVEKPTRTGDLGAVHVVVRH